jgi:3-oxoacyl-[acyl-carrier protein] reductase
MTATQPLERPTVLISGGSRGLGASIVRSLLADGHSVSTFSRKRTDLCGEFEQSHPERFLFVEGDMADKASLRAVVKGTTERFGRIDALVNNAGVADDGVLAMFPESRIDRLMAINLTGSLALTRLFVRHFIGGTPEEQSRGAAIVNISSIVGIRGYRGLSAYAATKSGMLGMTYALARELGDRGIRVNAICPGYLETEMTHGLDDMQRRQIINRTPLGRLGQPEDVSGVVRFLLSRDSAFMTGQSIVVDGGITC